MVILDQKAKIRILLMLWRWQSRKGVGEHSLRVLENILLGLPNQGVDEEEAGAVFEAFPGSGSLFGEVQLRVPFGGGLAESGPAF